MIAVVAALTMTVGNLVALRQWHAVRLLAWSTVAQGGYLLVPLAIASTAQGVPTTRCSRRWQATLAYLGIYAAMNLGAFAVVAAVSAGIGPAGDRRLPRPGALRRLAVAGVRAVPHRAGRAAARASPAWSRRSSSSGPPSTAT